MNKSYHIAVCDDEASQLEYLSLILNRWAQKHDYTLKVFNYKSSEDFLFYFEDRGAPDILLLDIQMGGQDGVSLAKQIYERDKSCAIVFITGMPDFIAEGYEVSALHYLLKPVSEDKLFEVLERAVLKTDKDEPTVMLTMLDNSVIRFVQKEILCVEAFAHTVRLHTAKGDFEAKIGLSELEAMLNCKLFIRCHRSYLVCICAIRLITKTEVVLDDDTVLPLSRRLYQDINKAFIAYYKGVEGQI